MNSLRMYASIVACLLCSITAPVVCLFYRGGWWNTPDDPLSPHGQYEPFMQKLYDRCGAWVNDYWWLVVRNSGYGMKYRLKPNYFKALHSYEGLKVWRVWVNDVRITGVLGFEEYAKEFGWFHVIWGYRMSPIFDEVMKNEAGAGIPFRKINMDARPIFSVRGGSLD